jgi:hypothetical protein
MLSVGTWVMIAFYFVVLGGGSAFLIAHALKHKNNV